jgi:hypothetical protein
MSEENYIIFRNPNIKYREESFGGIIKHRRKFLLINRDYYKILSGFKKTVLYSSFNEDEKKIIDFFTQKEILLKIDLKRAKQLGYK